MNIGDHENNAADTIAGGMGQPSIALLIIALLCCLIAWKSAQARGLLIGVILLILLAIVLNVGFSL